VTAPGLWNIAEQSRPGRRGRPGGRTSATRLAAEPTATAAACGHGLRAGTHRADDAQLRGVLAVHFPPAAGLYIVAVNWHLSAPRSPTSVRQRASVRAHQRFAEVAATAATRRVAPEARFAVGEVPGSARSPRWGRRADGRPDERTMGRRCSHLGTTGDPKGSAAAHRRRPDDVRAPQSGSRHLGIAPHHNTSTCAARRSTTPRAQLRDHLIQSATRRCGWTTGTPPRCSGCGEAPGQPQPLVPTQFARMLALPEQQRTGYDLSSCAR